LYDIDIGNKFI